MADLFERLLARAAGGTRAVRPQREVRDVLFVGTGIDREDDVSPDAPSEDGAERAVPAPRDTRERPARKDAPEPPRPPRREPPRTAAAPREDVVPHPPARAAAVEMPATVRPVHEVAARLDPGTAPSPGGSPAPRPVGRPDAAAPPADVRSRAALDPPVPVVARATAAPAPVAPAADPPLTDRNPAAAQHPPTHRPRTVSPRAAVAPTAPAPSRGIEDPAPVIRISIGRIDVRATTPRAPAAPVPRTEPAQPQLTLEAFLARNGDGGRR